MGSRVTDTEDRVSTGSGPPPTARRRSSNQPTGNCPLACDAVSTLETLLLLSAGQCLGIEPVELELEIGRSFLVNRHVRDVHLPDALDGVAGDGGLRDLRERPASDDAVPAAGVVGDDQRGDGRVVDEAAFLAVGCEPEPDVDIAALAVVAIRDRHRVGLVVVGEGDDADATAVEDAVDFVVREFDGVWL